MNLNDYFASIEFDYVKVFSAFRGKKYNDFKIGINDKIEQLQKDLRTARYMEIPKISAKIDALNKQIGLNKQTIIDDNGKFHSTTFEILKADKKSLFFKKLSKALLVKVETEVAAPCMPIFRDAIVFYSKDDNLCEVLQVCLECAQIINTQQEVLRTDYRTFEQLFKLLEEIGCFDI